eukprot:GILI01006121.1.p2 GENE.GILI01006121.1~~GILI01006121.1.p2  ORF type:complete len:290 (+),score=68.08 GILI01006121.1:146-1015(+)
MQAQGGEVERQVRLRACIRHHNSGFNSSPPPSPRPLPSSSFPINELRVFHLATGVIFFYEAVLAFMYAEPYYVNLTQSLAVTQRDSHGLSQPVIKRHYSVSIQYILSVYFSVATIHHVAILFPVIFDSWARWMQRGCNLFRWGEFALSAPVVAITMCLLVGITEVGSLLFLGGIISVCNMFGLLAELYPHTWAPHVIAWLIYLPFWIFVFGFVQASPLPLPPIAVRALTINFVFFSTFAVIQLMHKLRKGPLANYVVADCVYTVVSIMCKSSLGYAVYSHVNSTSRGPP